ncbi:MAG: hypothetical protein PUG67_08240 [Peptoniphilaceae bacterium]|nr:hypothetical protein [Peptoniphilaceae bacterium]MDY6019374.1 hypothetical protein [Anaerococcus sp.]
MNNLQNVFMQKTGDFLGIRITKTEKDLIKREAEKENMTYSNFVRKVLVDYFSEIEKEKNK